MTVYLLCFAPGIHRDARANSRHYLGFTEHNAERRLEQHLAGAGSPLVHAAASRGLNIRIARTWPNRDRNFERSLKNQHNLPRLCPLCTPAT